MFPWFAEDFAALAPLAAAAGILAAKEDWPALYDLEALRGTPVRCAAHVDSEDIFVEVELSRATAALLGPGCKLWVSDEFQHSGLGDGTGGVLDRLIGMAQKG